MTDYRRLFRTTSLKPPPEPKTRHYARGELLPPPSGLEIVQFTDDPGVYLLYLDPSDREMTDTYHDNVDAAFKQARFEFSVAPDEWEDVSGE